MIKDIIETVTAAGIYDLRLLQIKDCGRLGLRDVLALDCWPNILLFVPVTFRHYKVATQCRLSGITETNPEAASSLAKAYLNIYIKESLPAEP